MRVKARLTRVPEPKRDDAPRPQRYAIKAGAGVVFLDLAKTTYFEVVDGTVWARAAGRFQTLWKTLAEVEAAFPSAGLLRVHRHLLVRPEIILGVKPLWGAASW